MFTFEGKFIFSNYDEIGISLGILNVAVIIPVIRNIITAPNERNESLGKPHKPWPLVQPEANWVPKPTRNPATNKCVFGPETTLSKG